MSSLGWSFACAAQLRMLEAWLQVDPHNSFHVQLLRSSWDGRTCGSRTLLTRAFDRKTTITRRSYATLPE